MNNYDLSILIPARNEEFLTQTVEDILKNKRGKTEIIVGLDGYWSDPGIPDHDDVTIFHAEEPLGQRALTNALCRLSKAKYVMKIDAHCAVDEGFDVKMMSEMKDNYTMVPLMRNLHCFDWKCIGVTPVTGCGHRIYQGPTPEKCPKCGGKMEKDILWKAKESPRSTSFRFDTTLHFQYFGQYKKVQDTQGDIVDTMSIQGSCFMMTRAKYWELNICDEQFGSWGQQGVEVACKTWLSGGQVKCNKKTWYAHMFRTQGGDFSFPYKQSQKQIEHARKYSRELFLNNTWDKQIYPLSWLLDKFKPVPDWHDEQGKGMLEMVNKKGDEFYKKMPEYNPDLIYYEPKPKGIIFYTDNTVNLRLAHAVQKQLRSIKLPIVSISLKPMQHMGCNYYIPEKRGYLTMFKQILTGLENSTADIVYLCEHDVLYHPSHFDFIPKERGVIYYNVNVWKIRAEDGLALWVNNCRQVSGIVAYREDLLIHYRERIKYVEQNGFSRNMGFEPGTHGRVQWNYPLRAESFMSEYPNLDVRHDRNLTPNRWSPELFRDRRNCEGWTEKKVTELPGWNYKHEYHFYR